MPKPLSMEALDLPEFWIERRANELLTEHGLAEQGWKFAFCHSKQHLGWCKHTRKEIQFSSYFTHNEREEIEDVILHEIAHALVGPKHGHDYVWQMKCVEIGARPERLNSTSTTSATHNYIIECQKCGQQLKRHRLRPALLERYHCAKIIDGEVCKGKFEAYRND